MKHSKVKEIWIERTVGNKTVGLRAELIANSTPKDAHDELTIEVDKWAYGKVERMPEAAGKVAAPPAQKPKGTKRTEKMPEDIAEIKALVLAQIPEMDDKAFDDEIDRIRNDLGAEVVNEISAGLLLMREFGVRGEMPRIEDLNPEDTNISLIGKISKMGDLKKGEKNGNEWVMLPVWIEDEGEGSLKLTFWGSERKEGYEGIPCAMDAFKWSKGDTLKIRNAWKVVEGYKNPNYTGYVPHEIKFGKNATVERIPKPPAKTEHII